MVRTEPLVHGCGRALVVYINFELKGRMMVSDISRLERLLLVGVCSSFHAVLPAYENVRMEQEKKFCEVKVVS